MIRTPFVRRMLLAFLAMAAAASNSARGQWSSDPANNLTLADRTNEQVQPKIRAASGGGCYVSWYDNSTGGYDVYLQRLDGHGYELWLHNGILIADRGLSSTVDYGLAVDAGDNAIIAFTDDRFGERVTVQKVSPSGSLLWNGSSGVALSPAGVGVSPPQVAVLSDGNYAVVWNNTSEPTGTLIQKLSPGGVPLFPGNGILQNDTLSPQQSLMASDVRAGDNGSIIVLFVRFTMSSRQLYTQKYSASGAAQWNGGAPKLVMGSGSSIQFGYFPTFLPDGAGGAVYGWYETSTPRNACIQHVLSSGALKFAAPISNVGSTHPSSRIRVGAGLAYNQASGEYFLASPETDGSTQSQNSVMVQRFSSTGTRLWGDNGVTLLATTTSTQPSFVQAQVMGDGASVFWLQTVGTSGGVVKGARVGANQAIAWSEFLASDGSTDKSRLDSALSSCGFAMVAYGNGATGVMDIQAQNVQPNGTLGNVTVAGDMNCDGTINLQDIRPFVTALINPAGYSQQYPCCNAANADVNQDSFIDGLDVQPFVDLLLGR